MNITGYYISLICSALLLNCAFFWPYYCWWTLFIFLVPMIICFARYNWQPTALQGLVWGALFFGLHWIAIADVLVQHAQTRLSIACACYFFLVLYTSIYAAMWFVLLRRSKKISNDYYISMLLFILSSYLYFYIIYYHAFFIFGLDTGYSLGLIGIPLMATKYGRFLFMACGLTGTTMLILIGNALITHMLLTGKKYLCISLVIMSVALMVDKCTIDRYEQKNKKTPSHNSLAYVKPTQEDTARAILQKTISAIQNVKIEYPDVTLIVMPETTFAFEMDQFSIKMIQNNLYDDTKLLFGCYYQGNNSILCVNNERIIFTYEKTTYHPFSEILYWPWNLFKEKGWFPHLFLCGKEHDTVSDTKQNSWLISIDTKENLIFPAICSDLFFNTHAKIDKESDYIFFVCNDSWFSYYYFRNLMYLYAVYIALKNQKPVIYVGHTYAVSINAKGESTLLIQ